MSQKFRPGFADPLGIIIADDADKGLLAVGSSVPTDATAGYQKGCIFFKSGGSAGTVLYVNDGSATSCEFNAIGATDDGLLAVSSTSMVVNEDSNDMDIRIESNALANFLNIDASEILNGSISIGAAVPTNPQAMVALTPPANATGVTAAQSYYHATILPGGATVIPTGTAPIVASLNVAEPNITATGTVTVAATVRIADAPTEGGSNYALWVDAGVTRLDGNLEFSAALDVLVPAATAAALQVTNGTTSALDIDTRVTLKDVATTKLTGLAPTVASEAATHRNPTLEIAAKTITYTGTTGTTASLGAGLYINQPTWTDADMMTLSAVSNVHIATNAVAGGMLTISNSRMITTGVSDCLLTNAGVWTDTSCWEYGKESVSRIFERAKDRVYDVLDKLTPATWKYKNEFSVTDQATGETSTQYIDDFGRERVGIVYDDLPGELRAPGEERGVGAGNLASFALAALKVLRDDNEALKARIAALESA